MRWIPALVVVIGLALAGSLPASAAEPSTGSSSVRYQIVNTVMIVSGRETPVTILVDSSTGRTWILTVNESNLPLWHAIPLYSDMRPYPGDKTIRPSAD